MAGMAIMNRKIFGYLFRVMGIQIRVWFAILQALEHMIPLYGVKKFLDSKKCYNYLAAVS